MRSAQTLLLGLCGHACPINLQVECTDYLGVSKHWPPARDSCGYAAPADPATTPLERVPADYVARVRSVHESGGFGSTGCVPPGPGQARPGFLGIKDT